VEEREVNFFNSTNAHGMDAKKPNLSPLGQKKYNNKSRRI
jgi:hypothetical protein